MIISSAQRRFTVKRQTAFVLDKSTAAATMSLTRQPIVECVLQVRVYSGSANSGTVTITGLDSSGGSISETLTFVTQGYKQTTRRFVSVDAEGITTTGLTDDASIPSIEMKAYSPGGSIQNSLVTIVAGWPIYMDRNMPSRAEWKGEVPGFIQEEPVHLLIQWAENWAPREGDFLINDDSGEQFMITGAPLLEGYGRVSHWEAWGYRRADSV